jgi:hypothetical protein
MAAKIASLSRDKTENVISISSGKGLLLRPGRIKRFLEAHIGPLQILQSRAHSAGEHDAFKRKLPACSGFARRGSQDVRQRIMSLPIHATVQQRPRSASSGSADSRNRATPTYVNPDYEFANECADIAANILFLRSISASGSAWQHHAQDR